MHMWGLNLEDLVPESVGVRKRRKRYFLAGRVMTPLLLQHSGGGAGLKRQSLCGGCKAGGVETTTWSVELPRVLRTFPK